MTHPVAIMWGGLSKFTPTGAVDDYWDDVVFVSDFEGTDLSTDFSGLNDSDYDVIPDLVVRSPDANISTTQFKFGSSSLFTDTNGGANFPRMPDLSPGSRDFTFEGFVRITSQFGTDAWFGSWDQNSNEHEFAFGIDSNDKLVFFNAGNGTDLVGTTNMVLNQWYHVAVSRNGSTARIFLDGVMEAKQTDWGSAIVRCCMHNPTFGRTDHGFLEFTGYLDEWRITIGTGRYDSDSSFTPPTSIYPRTGGPAATLPSPAGAASTFDGTFTNITPEAHWGTILRNSAYAGAALRVADNASAAEQDVNFDANGFVTDALPYGDDTRVIKIYDQFGSDDLTCAKADDVRVIRNGLTHYTWLIDITGVGGLTSTHAAGDVSCAWDTVDWLYACGVVRKSNAGKVALFASRADDNLPMHSLYHNVHSLHWRVNSANRLNWSNSDIIANEDKCGMLLERAIGDHTQQDGNGYGYLNGTLEVTLGDGPNGFNVGDPFYVGDCTSWLAESAAVAEYMFTELSLFSRTGGVTGSEITTLDNALAEPVVV